MENSSDILYRNAASCLSQGDFAGARKIYADMLSADLFNRDIKAAMVYSSFWERRKLKYDAVSGHISKGKFLISQWKSFVTFTRKWGKGKGEYIITRIRQHIFNEALYSFTRAKNEFMVADGDILFCIGICHKRLGNHKDAVINLENANYKKQNDAAILAELADCMAIRGEDRKARLLFREAFFLNPQGVDIDFLESEKIRELADRIRNDGYSERALREWIPVYGAGCGYFNEKRELRPLEFDTLRRDLMNLESRLSSNDSERELVIPRLINRYLWLIDYYTARKNRIGTEETYRKIRDLNPDLYAIFTNNGENI